MLTISGLVLSTAARHRVYAGCWVTIALLVVWVLWMKRRYR